MSLLSQFGSSAQYAQRHRDLAERTAKDNYREPDRIVFDPAYNPAHILELAERHLVGAASLLFQACRQLGHGHRKRQHQYMLIGYDLAQKICSDEAALQKMHTFTEDRRYKDEKPPLADFLDRPFHHLFLFFFYQSGLTSKDVAHQWIQALEYYHKEGSSPVEVAKALKQHGENRLRKAAQLRKRLIAGAQEWAREGGNPATVTMDQALDKLSAKERARSAHDDDEPPEWNSREIPPDGSDLDDDADETINGDLNIEFEEDTTGTVDKGVGASPLKDEADEVVHDHLATNDLAGLNEPERGLPVVTRFLNEAMRVTTEIEVSLKSKVPLPKERAKLIDLAQELRRGAEMLKAKLGQTRKSFDRAEAS